MSRETIEKNKIAILATGDEIIQGDILNTNSQVISEKLSSLGMEVGFHLSAPDNIVEIEKSIIFLLQNHQAVILTGGLGPTSDDLTRFALSKVIKRELLFDEKTWENIVNRLTHFGFTVLPDGNRQQALFPEGAIIIPNPHGTAAGCYIQHGNQILFMLPGPPVECLPMVDKVVIPQLQALHFEKISYRKKWLLFGVSEGHIAEELDALTKNYDCITGYRICHPYLEFKIFSQHKTEFETLISLIEEKISPYILLNAEKTASAVLREYLPTISTTIMVSDQATGGLLEVSLRTPENSRVIYFSEMKQQINVSIHGLKEYWEKIKSTTTEFTIHFPNGEIRKTIPLRGDRVKQYAVELICAEIYKFIISNSNVMPACS